MAEQPLPSLIVIVGPTASGKSDLALALAESLGGGQILSVDSMQVYRGMNIGTAKPTPAERERVKHHLIDVVDPSEVFTTARFVELADDVIRRSRVAGTSLIATGGTPLYFKALFEGMFEGPGADASLRQQLSLLSNDVLHARLSSVDPLSAERIHLNDTRRLIRALEVFELTGSPISTLQTEWEREGKSFRHEASWFGLHWERDALNRRINARVKKMIDAGWVDETRRLLDRVGGFSPSAGEATGYRELSEYLAGKTSLEDAIEQIKIATRQLARRQMKWLRRWTQVKWLAGDQPIERNVAAMIASLPHA
jgi:tRNA dimethylallyltransferase